VIDPAGVDGDALDAIAFKAYERGPAAARPAVQAAVDAVLEFLGLGDAR